MTPAQEWASALRAAMKMRRMTIERLAQLTGLHYATVARWRTGTRSLPTYEHAVMVADALDRPSLAELAERLLSAPCDICGLRFIARRRSGQRYCSPRCNRVASWRAKQGSRVDENRLAKMRLALYQEVVARYCRGCEPSGVCLTPACDLRELSPLPLARRNVA